MAAAQENKPVSAWELAEGFVARVGPTAIRNLFQLIDPADQTAPIAIMGRLLAMMRGGMACYLQDKALEIVRTLPLSEGTAEEELLRVAQMRAILDHFRKVRPLWREENIQTISRMFVEIFQSVHLDKANDRQKRSVFEDLCRLICYTPSFTLPVHCSTDEVQKFRNELLKQIKARMRDLSKTGLLIALIQNPMAVEAPQPRFKQLIAHGVDVDNTSMKESSFVYNFSFLHWCIKYRRWDFLPLLMLIVDEKTKHHADNHGRTPAHYALWLGLYQRHISITELSEALTVLQASTLPESRASSDLFYSSYLRWPLFYLSFGSFRNIDPPAADHRSWNALHFIAYYADRDEISALLPLVFKRGLLEQVEAVYQKTPQQLIKKRFKLEDTAEPGPGTPAGRIIGAFSEALRPLLAGATAPALGENNV